MSRSSWIFVEVQSVGSDINKNRAGAAQHESVHCRNKGERRDNHFITGLNVEEECSHFKRMSAGSGQKNLRYIHHLFENGLAPLRKQTVARNLPEIDRLGDVVQLVPHEAGLVERDQDLTHVDSYPRPATAIPNTMRASPTHLLTENAS